MWLKINLSLCPTPWPPPPPPPNLLTPWCRILLEELTGLHLVKKFSAFHGTRKFITALTGFCYLSLSWTSPIQSIYPHSTSWKSILILSTHLRLDLPSGLLPSSFPTRPYTPLYSPTRATCPTYLISLLTTFVRFRDKSEFEEGGVLLTLAEIRRELLAALDGTSIDDFIQYSQQWEWRGVAASSHEGGVAWLEVD